MADYYSINEAKKDEAKRVYHNNENCKVGVDIPTDERRSGKNGYRLCQDC